MLAHSPNPPILPPFLRRLPPPPLAGPVAGHAFSALLRRIAQRQPGILARLGPWGRARFLLDVTDMPLLLVMTPAAGRITAHRRGAPPAHEARITGPLAAFLAMLHGVEDGDALFFSGGLEISGDTSAVLALRNALDDAELDLTEEIAVLAGRWGGLVRGASERIARRSGLALSRQEVMR